MDSIPNIKVDASAKPMPLFPGETITEGLDGLPKRVKEYYDLGARFATLRAVILIGENGRPQGSIGANMEALARHAALCQDERAGEIESVEQRAGATRGLIAT